ncbi:MAG: helix-turn-helix domain-containing protein [Mycobacteriaceae bacterium]
MTGDWRGVLYPAELPTFHRVPAPVRVASLVRWFWIPEWNITAGRVSRQELIAFPACNLAVEPELVGLAGPTTRRSFRDLSGRGWAVGALLRPAAVAWFTAEPTHLCDRYEILDLPQLHAVVAAAMTSDEADDERRTRAVEGFADWLAATVPAPDTDGVLANAMAELIDGDQSVLQVTDAAARLGVSVRTLQRLARRHVGVSPLAMIRRRRLQEAAERLRGDPTTDIAAVAADLGYSDHAHLAGDFRTVLGFTPSSYRGSSLGGGPAAKPLDGGGSVAGWTPR